MFVGLFVGCSFPFFLLFFAVFTTTFSFVCYGVISLLPIRSVTVAKVEIKSLLQLLRAIFVT